MVKGIIKLIQHSKAIVAVALLLVLAGPLTSEISSSKIDVIATTSVGTILDAGAVELLNPVTLAPLNAHFDGFHAVAIPYGDYLLRVKVPGFRNHQQPLRVYQTHVYVRIRLTISRVIDEEPLSIRGVIRPAPRRPDEVWVKLVPLLTGTPVMDYLVDPNGHFSFSGVDRGEYLALVIRGEQCILTKQVNTSMSSLELVVPDR